MWILPILGYIGLLLGFAFLTLAIASGLYYLSELVEEHTVFAKKFLRQLIFGVVAFQVLLSLIDGLPWVTTLVSIASQGVYFQNLRHFPTVRLSDPIFILSCILVLLNHYLWFQHFSAPPPRSHASSYYGTDFHSRQHLPSFTEIASFFFLQVWLVPFALFVSLSASENVLPSMGSEYATDHSGAGASSSARGGGGGGGYMSSRGGGGGSSAAGGGMGMDMDASGKKKASKGMARAAVDGVLDWASETGELLGFWKGERTRQW